MYKIGGRILILVHQFPFRKRSLSFLTVDATIGSQALSRVMVDVIIFPGLSYNEANRTFFNGLRKNDVEAQVEVTSKVMERATRVNCY